MIAADTSTLSARLAGEQNLARGDVCLPTVVLTEILSDPAVAKLLAPRLLDLELLDVSEGYWQRAGETRAKLHKRGLKAKVADALIAQSCIDHDVALITRDQDIRDFARHCGLRLGE